MNTSISFLFPLVVYKLCRLMGSGGDGNSSVALSNLLIVEGMRLVSLTYKVKVNRYCNKISLLL